MGIEFNLSLPWRVVNVGDAYAGGVELNESWSADDEGFDSIIRKPIVGKHAYTVIVDTPRLFIWRENDHEDVTQIFFRKELIE